MKKTQLFSIVAILAALIATSCSQTTDKEENQQTTTAKTEQTMTTTDHAQYQSSNPEGMQQVYEFVKNCEVYYIATVDGDQPRVRPFGTIAIYEGKLYIQTGRIKRVAHQLNENPKAELCAFNGKEWIRVNGTLVDDQRIEAKKYMLDQYPSLRSMYDENDTNTMVLYFTHSHATISSFSAKDIDIDF